MFLDISNSTIEVSAYRVLLTTVFTQRNLSHVSSTISTENLREEENKMGSLTKFQWDLNLESYYIIMGLNFSPGTTFESY